MTRPTIIAEERFGRAGISALGVTLELATKVTSPPPPTTTALATGPPGASPAVSFCTRIISPMRRWACNGISKA